MPVRMSENTHGAAPQTRHQNTKKNTTMKVIIDQAVFPSGIGKQILKAKHGQCFVPALEKEWDAIPKLTFASIIRNLSDIKLRRIAFKYLGLQRMLAELRSKLVSSETIRKTALWVEADGSLVSREYDDTYELYRVDWQDLYVGVSTDKMSESMLRELQQDRHFVKFRDTSTGKEYVIWVDIRSVYETNYSNPDASAIPKLNRNLEPLVSPIMAIAWTFQTDLPENGIESIVRQGDCVLMKKFRTVQMLNKPRHLKEYEYRKLLNNES